MSFLQQIRVSLLLWPVIFMALVSAAQSSEQPPMVEIFHPQAESFLQGQNISLRLKVVSDIPVITGRCYFRFAGTLPFIYVELDKLQGTPFYEGILPAAAAGVDQLEYFFLLVNEKRQVIRTMSYRQTLSPGIPSFAPAESITVYTELPETPNLQPFLSQKLTVQITTGEKAYGLIGGSYSGGDFPGYSYVEGYFGGFLSTSEGITPQKGILLQADNEFASESRRVRKNWSAIIPDISGDDWSGTFFVEDGDLEYGIQPIIAVITQLKGREYHIIIKTSKAAIGRMLEGTIHTNGHILAYDKFDGEDWTTAYGPATPSVLNLLDYIRPPVAGEPQPPLNRIRLTRTVIAAHNPSSLPFVPLLLQ